MNVIWFDLEGRRACGELVKKGKTYWHVKLENGDIIKRHAVKHRCKQIR